MTMFIIGFVSAWVALGTFFYFGGTSHGTGFSIVNGTKWGAVLMMLPIYPIGWLIETIAIKRRS